MPFQVTFVCKSPFTLVTLEALEPSVDILSVSRQVINPTKARPTFLALAALLSFLGPLGVNHLDVLVQPHHGLGTTLDRTDCSDSQMDRLDVPGEVTFLIEAQVALRTELRLYSFVKYCSYGVS